MKLLHHIFRHFELKLLALALALLVWFHVATNQAYDIDVTYQLSYVNLPPLLTLAAPPPARATVRLRGAGKTILHLLLQDRRWPVDVSAAESGPMAVHLAPELAPRYGIVGLEGIELVSPAQLRLLIDSVGRKKVPVVFAAAVQTEAGYVAVGAPVLTPDSVTVSGPRSALAAIDNVSTRSLVRRDLRQTIAESVNLVTPPGYHVRIEPTQARYYQKIEPYVRRTLAALPIRVSRSNPSDSMAVVPPQATVEVGGPQSAMNAVAPDSIDVFVAVTPGIAAAELVPVSARVHPPLAVLKVLPDSATVVKYGRRPSHPRN